MMVSEWIAMLVYARELGLTEETVFARAFKRSFYKDQDNKENTIQSPA